MPDTNSSPSTSYPTKWYSFDVEADINVRQLSEDTYEIVTPSMVVMVNKEAFNYFRESNMRAFFIWIDENNVEIKERTKDGN